MPKLGQSNCILYSSNVASYLDETIVPNYAISPEMYTDRPLNPNGYKSCTLFYQCLPENCDVDIDHLVFPEDQTTCLTKEYLEQNKCQNKNRIFKVIFNCRNHIAIKFLYQKNL